MAYYTQPAQKQDGETIFAADVNDLGDAAANAFAQVDTDMQGQQTLVESYAAAASDSADAAGDSASAASGSAVDASDFTDKAQEWAENAEDVEVETGEYSALHHSAKAALAQASAENSASFEGDWSAGTYTQPASVYHSDHFWNLLVASTTEEPSDVATDWVRTDTGYTEAEADAITDAIAADVALCYTKTEADAITDPIAADVALCYTKTEADAITDTKAEVISQVYIYLATTGDDVTGDGTVGSPWYSLEKAIDYLDDKFIEYCIISIAAGTYTGLGRVLIKTPHANRLTIVGDDKATTILTFTTDGIDVQGVALNYISALTLKGVDATSRSGISVSVGGSISSVSNVKVDTFGTGIDASGGSVVDLYSVDIYNCKTAIYLTGNSYLVSSSTSTIDCNSLASSIGIRAYEDCTVRFDSCDISNAVDAIKAERSSKVYAEYVTFSGITGYDGWAHSNSFISVNGSTGGTSFNPAVTTGNVPTFSNAGSWIYKP